MVFGHGDMRLEENEKEKKKPNEKRQRDPASPSMTHQLSKLRVGRDDKDAQVARRIHAAPLCAEHLRGSGVWVKTTGASPSHTSAENTHDAKP